MCIWRVGLFRPFDCSFWPCSSSDAQGRDQATGRRPAGIACVRVSLGLLSVAALGLLPLTLPLLLPCFSASPLDLVGSITMLRGGGAALTTRPWVNGQTRSLVYVLSQAFPSLLLLTFFRLRSCFLSPSMRLLCVFQHWARNCLCISHSCQSGGWLVRSGLMCGACGAWVAVEGVRGYVSWGSRVYFHRECC